MRSFLQRQLFSTLILADHNGQKINKSTLKVLAAASKLNKPNTLLVVSNNTEPLVEDLKQLKLDKVSKVITVQNDQLRSPQADTLSQILKELIEKYKFQNIVGSTSAIVKDTFPRVAAQFSSQAVTDIIEVLSDNTFKRPVYAGNAISTVQTTDKIKFLSFRPTNFEETQGGGNSQLVFEQFQSNLVKSSIEHVRDELQVSDKPELTSARIVVSGGRGMQNKENFKILDELAEAFGNAAVGASRAAVDAGFVSNDLQIGQTGKVVAPEIYFAVGISGAIQHLAGMKDSKVIVAINKDPEASIIQVANYSLIGDLFKIIPELTQRIRQQK